MRSISRFVPIVSVAVLLGACANTPAEKTYPASSGVASSTPSAANAAAAAAAARADAERRAAIAAQQAQAPAMATGPVSERTVYFGYDDFTIDSRDADLLTRHARILGTVPNTPVRVEGHADERGSVEYNLALGQRRADAVRRALTTLGVRGEMVESVSFGELRPADQGSADDAMARNRRAELVYSSR